MGTEMRTTRRGLLALAGGAAAGVAVGAGASRAQTVATNAKVVIIGAGAAGTGIANRLVRRLEGAEITIIDARPEHLYQPGLSLVAAGLKPADYVVSRTTGCRAAWR